MDEIVVESQKNPSKLKVIYKGKSLSVNCE